MEGKLAPSAPPAGRTASGTAATFVCTEAATFEWDDWLLLLERKEDADGGFTDIEYVWGPDLSGAMQGAGGVGGLLAVSVDGDYYFPFYDNNGNVMGYADENRSCAARYDYDAFGNLVASSGPMADFFPHRFSTKYLDPDLGLYYYGYRWYSPDTKGTDHGRTLHPRATVS